MSAAGKLASVNRAMLLSLVDEVKECRARVKRLELAVFNKNGCRE